MLVVTSSGFQRLIDTLNHDDSDIKRRLSDMTRRITVYRVNEKALTRRYQTMEEMDAQQRKVVLISIQVPTSNFFAKLYFSCTCTFPMFIFTSYAVLITCNHEEM